MGGARVDEVDESSAAVELGKKESGVGFGLGGFEPLEAGSEGAVVGATFAEDSATVAAHSHHRLIF